MKQPALPFKLNEAEKHSATWSRMKTHYTERLRVLRERNDGDLDPVETARVRGAIAEIKTLLELDAPAIKPGDPTAAG